MIDTHCHLNFKVFKSIVSEVINQAANAGITHIVVPGTDIVSSKKALEIANQFENVYAAVGIHPHHAFNMKCQTTNDKPALSSDRFQIEKEEIEKLLKHEKVVAIGEVGLDRHVYKQTKYENYHIDEDFINSQKELLISQIQLAIKYHKSLILHNRETVEELLTLVTNAWNSKLEGRTVLHCCEPNDTLLTFAKSHHIFIGVDGDITYKKDKQEFIRNVPLEMLVLETDAPYLLPEPLRSQKKYPNTPASIPYIVKMIASLKGESAETVVLQTTTNAKRLFHLW